MDQAAPANQALYGRERERGEDANLVRGGKLRAYRDRQNKTETFKPAHPAPLSE